MNLSPRYPCLDRLLSAQLAAFPAHEKFLRHRFDGAEPADLEFTEGLARTIETVVGAELQEHLEGYRWLCECVLEEELFFRRNNRYRLSTFADAEREVYSNKPLMRRYMNGLLMSQLWWHNHTAVMRFFQDTYLSGNAGDTAHLEIGPGHGLFLLLAATGNCRSVSGWDVSEASIALTRRTLDAVAPGKSIALSLVNMFEAPGGQFGSIVFSEVLEHLEQPEQALQTIRRLLAPGGRAFINAPVNSPAPDHLKLFRTPEEIIDMIQDAGLAVEQTLFAPTNGLTLAQARKRSSTISTAAIVRKPA